MRLNAEAWHAKTSGAVAAAWVFVLFLAAVFGVEFGIMSILPAIVPADDKGSWPAVLDGTILTAALAPLAWWGFVRPLRRLADTRGRLLGRLLESQESERRRLAADLHDGLGQNLTTMLLRLKVIEDSAQVPAVKENAAALRQIASDSLAEIRRLVRDTRPPMLDDLGLEAALDRQLEEVALATGIATRVLWSGVDSRLPEAIETVIYRVVQEAVTNAARHADARRIEVSIDCRRDAVVTTIEDDGGGFDVRMALEPERRPFGLLGMQERVAAAGGTVDVISQPGRGTTVRVNIPFHGKGDPA